ncbi:MAG: Eco57I restriction-modification methylase domain-containing protein [Prevotella koreensis]|uniref:Eco57I restriction-modification methylase domain-containing protein n=1 Tax=Prevotella koreensis TaxID=2490854 RepID=UPI003FA171C0
MNKAELRNKLKENFNLETWKNILGKMFHKIDYLSVPNLIEDKSVRNGGQIGTIRLDDNHSLALFAIEVADNIDIARNRKGLRNIAIRYIDQDIIHGILVFYYSKKQIDYRLTFVSKTTALNEMGEFQTEETAPKRYTFLLGGNEPCTTAAIRLYELVKKENVILSDVTDAFSVERLNKDFFKGYKDRYKKFCDFLTGNAKDNRDYVKKLLGRLVFLQFLQKKGWMSVPAGSKAWEGGDKAYMQKLVEHYKDNDRLLSDVLEPLFFNTLNEARPNDIADARLGDNIKIPYLNGGLFDKDALDNRDIDFPYSYFQELMEFFSEYNFTIDENDPDDAEVGIDPEMLGHIFENLLEDNKDKGAFYTPKEIVQYMCRETIVQYLKSHVAEQLYPSVETLIKQGVVDAELQSKTKANEIYNLLKTVKVCDPAIGSGAFPMGILNVLYHARMQLYGFLKSTEDFSHAKVKRDIIQNNIFGVDIEQGAVDIARLRFWLALVVDETMPQPLPNLDYKIMCGNSQLCRYPLDMPIEGVFVEYNRKGKEKASKEGQQWENFTLDTYKSLVTSYTEEHLNKTTLRSKIAEIKDCFKTTLARGDIKKRQAAERLVSEYEETPIFGERKAILDPDGYKKAKSSLARMKKMEEEVLNNKYYQNSFEWRFEYPQLLDDQGYFTGFDIIIANPPYIKEGRMSKTFFEPYKKSPYYKGKMDIWYLFACNCIDLLKDNGSLCFIATNNWTTSFGAGILRNKVIKETRICKLIDFGAVMMFESASIQTMIMLFNKDKVTDDYSFDYRRLTTNNATEKDAIELLDGTSSNSVSFQPVVRRGNYINSSLTFSMNNDIFTLLSSINDKIYLQRKEIAQGIVFPQDALNAKSQRLLGNQYRVGQGVFVLSDTEIEELDLSDIECDLIKPYYTTEQIERYRVNPHNILWTIYTNSSYKSIHSLDNMPHIKNHLDQFQEIITSDNKPYGLHRAREEHFFVNEKIIALRKSVDRPKFAFCNFPCYVSQTFNIIQTDRVDMKYLTGLLNSKLIEFWLKNKGKMQGSNFQLDKEPLLQIPIAVPSIEMQSLIAKLVDCIILINNVHDVRINKFVSNEYLAKMFELLIDGCVYEIYLGEELHSIGIHVFDTIRNIVENCSIDNDNLASVSDLYKSIEETGIIQKLDNLEHYNSDIFKPIIMN